MAPPRTRSARDKRKIDELTAQNRFLTEELAQLRRQAQMQEPEDQGGDVEVEEDGSVVQVLPNDEQSDFVDGTAAAAASNNNNTDPDEDYQSTEAITGIDGERLDGGGGGGGDDNGDDEEARDEEQELLAGIHRNINEAEENGTEEQEENGSDEDEESESTVHNEIAPAFEPDLAAYAKLSDNAKASEADSPTMVLAMFSVTKGHQAYQYYLEGFGVRWQSFLEERYENFEVGKRTGDPLVDLYVGVWRERGSEQPGRRNHVGLIWRNESGTLCVFDPHNNNFCYNSPNIINPGSRKLGTVNLITGVYPLNTPMANEIEVIDLL
mmetsp:Transcript_21917/g.62860  ORF Transcript_21917/g.62860 Transcript_21917/m.62860 type:complete len:324 (-) Transcript_21917:3893-4864(-)